MNVKKFVRAWLAYVIVTFAMGFTWHLVLFRDLYRELAIYSRLDDPIIPLGVASMLIQGAILAYIYPHLSPRRNPPVDGIKFGVLMGIFLASSAVLAEGAKQNVTSLSTWLLIESGYYVIQFGLSGLVIGLLYGKAVVGSRAAGQ